MIQSMGYEIVVIGGSTGGLNALESLLLELPSDYRLPLVVTLHRSVESGEMLCAVLRRYTALMVREPQDKEAILERHLYLAPSDYHLLVEDGYFSLSTEGPVSYARPSIDVLFESAADAYMQAVIGVVMTGANNDGANGVMRIEKRGGLVLVQAPETAECGVMPRAALAAVMTGHALPITKIAKALIDAEKACF